MKRTITPMKRTKTAKPEPEQKRGFGFCQDCRQREAKYMTLTGKNKEYPSLLICKICTTNHRQQGYISWHLPEKGGF